MGDPIDIAALARHGIAVIVATLDDDERPQMSRAWGPALSDDGQRFTVCVEAAPASGMAGALRPGRPVAAMLARLTSHMSVQLKGEALEVGPPTPARLGVVEAHVAGFVAETAQVGVPAEIANALVGTDLVTLTMAVSERYDETPGTGAGRPL